MNLNFSDEQVMLRDQLQKFCEAEYDFYKREEILKSNKDFDENVWSLFAEQGWLSIPFSEESGGFGFGPIETSILFEEFGKALVLEPYLANVILSGSLLDKSNFKDKVSLIEGIATGESHISLAYAESNNSLYDYDNLKTNLKASTLNGVKTLVLNGNNANKFIVLASSDDGPILVIVNSDADGVSIKAMQTIDGQSCAEVSFDNVAVVDESIIASGDDAKKLFDDVINFACLCVSAEAVGCMTACYEKTVQYTKEREQFDQPISNFQVLQHRMVDMFIESEICRSLLFKAMLETDADLETKYKSVSALKAQIGKSGKFSAEQAVQLHGGMGVSEEMMIGHYLKKLIYIDALFGNSDYHIEKYSKLFTFRVFFFFKNHYY